MSAPEVTTVSGDYEFPINIEVTDGNDVYYTTDGSDPTQNSAVYSGPIPMPLGNRLFVSYGSQKEEKAISLKKL